MTENTGRRPVAIYTDVDDTDPAAGIALLEAHGFEVRVLGTRDPAEIIAGAQDADALLPGYASVTRAMIEQLPNLKVIALMSMGFDYVDVDAATEHGVWVTNLPGVATPEVATHALAIVLASVRQLRFYTASATPTGWNDRSLKAPPRMSELTLGVIGLGRIGKEFARLATPLFGRVLGYDPMLPDSAETQAELAGLGVARVGLEELRRGANVVSLHLPLTAETDRMIDSEFLAEMPAGSFLVNVSRGALVDSAALAAALDSGRLAGAALDVLEEEPPTPGHPLLGRDDVVLTPHIAYLSTYTEAEYVRIQAQNAITMLETGAPDTPVNRPV
ncbi:MULTISPECIES: C-terminal binding protein [unclassified Microbacterium]|uniref:C-terminal binding protein n=1 Tax=unclassified Microbacterium TaxID=2609290 RepID=UPI000EA982D2|nr:MULTISPECIES: C-terminal binding protein [unclassified Microbacterium]MBT2483870.1 C-terminal binding protein [Microbacterium sp. ISL-108]RKN66851.1 C-terminal binding protein [Microbacterium sp. CGR2]